MPFDETVLLRDVQEAIRALGGSCRTIELADELRWGRSETGTEGLDLTALREVLKLYPQRFALRGNEVTVAESTKDGLAEELQGDPDIHEAAQRHVEAKYVGAAATLDGQDFNEKLWLHRVEAALDSFGGECEIDDLADRLLWGSRGTHSEGKGLRQFLHRHRQRFGLQASRVWSLFLLDRIGPCPKAAEAFNEPLWLDRVKRAIDQQLREQHLDAGELLCANGGCTLQDLYLKLDWGSQKNETHGRSLRKFIESHSSEFDLKGYFVSPCFAGREMCDNKATDTAAIEENGRVALISSGGTTSANNDCINASYEFTFGPNKGSMLRLCPWQSSSILSVPCSVTPRTKATAADGGSLLEPEEYWVKRIVAGVQRFGGVCSTTDLEDLLLWGEAGSTTGTRSLRALLRDNQRHFAVDGHLVLLRTHADVAALESPEENAARLAEAVVRYYGGTCTVSDIHRKLRWGRSQTTAAFAHMPLGEFLASRGRRFRLGGRPAPGAADGRSLMSVSLRTGENFEEELWLLCVATAIEASRFVGESCEVEPDGAGLDGGSGNGFPPARRGICTTRDIYRRTGWGRPGSGSHGRSLREFLVGRKFTLDGFNLIAPQKAGGGEEDSLLWRIDAITYGAEAALRRKQQKQQQQGQEHEDENMRTEENLIASDATAAAADADGLSSADSHMSKLPKEAPGPTEWLKMYRDCFVGGSGPRRARRQPSDKDDTGISAEID